ncbi:MAG: glycoside hydrolase family 88 protein [Bacteroidetes bacterium]|nr:glycoside hydrolase family 88 protein [Bacteroidota bacterium]
MSFAQTASLKNKMKALIQDNFTFAAKQYQYLKANTPDSVMPRSYVAATGKSVTSDTKWWCSGFYPGTLWYLYAYTKDEAIKKEAEQRLAILEKEKYYTGNHDLGFMMFCSFGTAYKYTNNPAYKDVVTIAAKSLSTRYRPAIKSIQSWNSRDILKCPVIIDNMMNLELLHWVSDHGGDPIFKEIAVTHANTTIANQFRPDNSSYHVVDWDLNTATVLKKITWQGAADSSAWSRGQTWGLYGYTMMYRFTKNPAYLSQAKKIAHFILSNPNLPSDKIPYWDFDAPGIPNVPRDASSGAIMASALLELGQFTSGAEKKEYIQTAETILQSLSSPAYRAKLGENGGFLLMHSVGSLPHKSEVDAPLTYADYYFIEALTRYKDWYLK